MKLDILAIGIHPDDVELSCGGTLLKHHSLGYKTGILDLTHGELGTRGTPTLRLEEAAHAAKILHLSVREHLAFRDGFSINDEAHQLEIIRIIRKYQPNIVLANAVSDRHPDHGKAAKMISDSCFLSGLSKINTTDESITQQAWRPKALYHYIQAQYIEPDFVVDISGFEKQKMDAIMAYKSQFYSAESTEPSTFISSPEFLDFIRCKDVLWGTTIGVKSAEGFTKSRLVGVSDITTLL